MNGENERVLIETKERAKSNTKRIDSLEREIQMIKEDQKAIYEIATSVKVIAERVSYIEEKIDETGIKVDTQIEEWRKTESKLANRIAESENASGNQLVKNINALKLSVITAICVAVATGLLTTLIRLWINNN